MALSRSRIVCRRACATPMKVNARTYHVSVESGRGEEVVPGAAFAVSQQRRLLQLLAEVDLQNSEHALRSLAGVLQAVQRTAVMVSYTNLALAGTGRAVHCDVSAMWVCVVNLHVCNCFPKGTSSVPVIIRGKH